jgi:signal transduction histidine kinase
MKLSLPRTMPIRLLTNAFATVLRARIWTGNCLRPNFLKFNQPPLLRRSSKHWLDPASLQFRLTLGVTAVLILGLSGISAWTGWKMQEILINTHTDNIEYLEERFPLDVQLYNNSFSMETSLQRTIDKAPPDVLMWVEGTNGEVIAQSQAIREAEPSFRERLFSLYEMPEKPEIEKVDQRYLVMCRGELVVRGTTLGQLQIVQDITNDQLLLNRSMQGLRIVTLFSVALLGIITAWYIQRSLRPLRRMSHIASTISANDLSQAKMPTDQAPTEVKELVEKLNEMLSRLGFAWEQQRQLIGDISHELRTPLTVTYGSLQCLQRREASLNETQQELLGTAISETDRTIQLLQSLLDLARADHSCMCFRSETLVLNELVADVIKLAERNWRCPIQINANETIWITSDRNRLNQILTNLLDNAVKYSPPEQPVVVTLSQSHSNVMIEVRDYGCGIALSQQERIFDRFYRVDDTRSRATGGVGLGLSIVKTLVEKMGGRISVWSHPEEGSLFTVILPSELNR